MGPITTANHMADAFHPGGYIAEELEARGWTPEYLAGSLGVSIDDVFVMLREETTGQEVFRWADKLAEIFGTSPDLFKNMYGNYRVKSLMGDKVK